jgi:hypothetical protein
VEGSISSARAQNGGAWICAWDIPPASITHINDR